MTFWRRWTETNIEKLLRLNLEKLEKIMSAIEDLKNAAADIAADAVAAHDEIVVALDHIVKMVDNDPAILAVVDSLKESHASMVDSVKLLKDKVDSVLASGGST